MSAARQDRSISAALVVAVWTLAAYAFFIRKAGGALATHDADSLRTFASFYLSPYGLDRVLDGYRSHVMPRLRKWPGFCGVSMLVDRETGRGVGVASFASRETVVRSRNQARSLREQFAHAAGARIEDVAEMDLVLPHLRVPETV